MAAVHLRPETERYAEEARNDKNLLHIGNHEAAGVNVYKVNNGNEPYSAQSGRNRKFRQIIGKNLQGGHGKKQHCYQQQKKLYADESIYRPAQAVHFAHHVSYPDGDKLQQQTAKEIGQPPFFGQFSLIDDNYGATQYQE